jgi:hypothetical protein
MAPDAIVRFQLRVTELETVISGSPLRRWQRAEIVAPLQLVLPTRSTMGGVLCRPLPRANQRQSRSGGVSDPPSGAFKSVLSPVRWVAHARIAGAETAVRIPSPRAKDGRAMRRILIDTRDLDTLIERWKEVNDPNANRTSEIHPGT